jgi:hypothetical protein
MDNFASLSDLQNTSLVFATEQVVVWVSISTGVAVLSAGIITAAVGIGADVSIATIDTVTATDIRVAL